MVNLKFWNKRLITFIDGDETYYGKVVRIESPVRYSWEKQKDHREYAIERDTGQRIEISNKTVRARGNYCLEKIIERSSAKPRGKK